MSKNNKKNRVKKGNKKEQVQEKEKDNKTENFEQNNNDFDFNENDENIIIKAFQHFDVDNSGKINVDEIKHVLTLLGDIMSEEEVDKFFNSVEIDKNGYLNYRDFIHFWMNND
jgi:Ca2+-binding EF-hand superfamily protein